MLSTRTSAARRLRRFLAPVSLSVLLHVFVVLQAAPAPPGEPGEPAPIDVYLTPAPEREPAADESPNPHPRSAIPVGVAPPRVTSSPAESRAPPGVLEQPRAPATDPGRGPSRERHDHPPGPAELEPVELQLMPAPPSSVSAPEARASYEPLPDEPKPKIAPVYHHVPGVERPASMPPPAAPGVGASFDFWSPPVFEEEMARATETIGRAEEEHQRRKNTDLGHGVICNAGNGWFVCAYDDIERCNRDHDGNCRYAEPVERYQLETDHLF
jgi:hypothetical protein